MPHLKPVEIYSREERILWFEKKKELRTHNAWVNRKKYYPHKMQQWEDEGREIERKYNIQLQKLNEERIVIEKEQKKMLQEELEAEKIRKEEKYKAIALKKKENARKRKEENISPRRSARIKRQNE